MPIFLSCAHCQTTAPLGGPVDFSRPVTCGHCGGVIEDFSGQGGHVIGPLSTGVASSRARPAQQSAVGHLLGVLAGGVAGLALGYYLLNLLGGPQFDWLKVPLPGVPHTERHRTVTGEPTVVSPAWSDLTVAAQARSEPPARSSGDFSPAATMPSEPLPLMVEHASPLPADEPLAPAPASSTDASLQQPYRLAQEAVPAQPASPVIATGDVPGELPSGAADAAEPIASQASPPMIDAVDPFDPPSASQSSAVDVFATTSELIEQHQSPNRQTIANQQPLSRLVNADPIEFSELVRRLKESEALLHCRQCGGAGMVGPPAHASGVVRAAPGDAPHELLPCRQCNGRRVDNVPAEAYRQLCGLAEGATVVRVEPTDDAQPIRQRMQDLLLAVASGRDVLNSLGRQAAYRFEQPVKSCEGVALAGTITEIGRQGELHLARVVLFGTPKAVPVLSAAPIDAHVRDRVVVLGVIVTAPQAQVVGYNGPDETIVWGGFRVAWAP